MRVYLVDLRRVAAFDIISKTEGFHTRPSADSRARTLADVILLLSWRVQTGRRRCRPAPRIISARLCTKYPPSADIKTLRYIIIYRVCVRVVGTASAVTSGAAGKTAGGHHKRGNRRYIRYRCGGGRSYDGPRKYGQCANRYTYGSPAAGQWIRRLVAIYILAIRTVVAPKIMVRNTRRFHQLTIPKTR